MARTNLAKKLSKIPATRTLAVSLSPEIADTYQAQDPDHDLGAILSDRLEDRLVINHTSETPIYITDAERKELDLLLGYNFKTGKQLIDRLKSLFTVVRIKDNESIEDLVMSPDQLFRLTERARIRALSVPKLAKQLAESGINTEIGLY